MPRIRTLKPEHRQHRKVGALDHITYRLWVGMILEADDEGRLVYDPEALRVLIFGYDVKVSRAIVERSTNVLADVGLVNLYRVQGQDYACFPSWHDHQRIDRPKPSLLPVCEASTIIRRTIDDPSRKCRRDLDLDLEGKGSRSDLDQDTAAPRANGPIRNARTVAASPPTAVPPALNVWQIPEPILKAIRKAPSLARIHGADRLTRDTAWWQAQTQAHPMLDLAACVLAAEAWLVTNPSKAARKRDAVRFLYNWFVNEEA